ncbi:MAG: sigma-70 family RNA polymerase sigma factor [Acidobacteriota bacterium]
MTSEPPANEPPQLVEHFFRHESAKLVAVLTRAFGVRHLDLVEDKVQEAMMAAVETWSRRGTPKHPGGWIYRVARNRVLDTLRREKIHRRALALAQQTEAGIEALVDDWLADDRLPDSLLRMMFVCCHPALDRRSQLALTLKILCGFSLAEIARGLLMSVEATKKRVQRAKKTLEQHQIRVELPEATELQERLAAVHQVLYLMFNEGYSTSQGHEPLRDDICEEAARLCHLLCEHEAFSTPDSRALLALMLAHAARLDARVDADGAAVLLAAQDRSRWSQPMIAMAERWLLRSKTEAPSRFHLEAAIALVHCRAPRVEATDWRLIVKFYDRLLALHASPLYALNRAVARGEAGDVESAMTELEALRDHRELRGYFLLDCAIGRLHELAENPTAAAAAYSAARAIARAPHEQALLEKKLRRLSSS